MALYDSLHCALTWIDIDRINIDWKDQELIRRLWRLHGKVIMEAWRQDPVNAGSRPKIWWHIFTKKEDFKILRYEKHTNLGGEPEPLEIWPDGHLEYEYPIYEGQSAFLKRLNFLEAWEISEFENIKTKAQFETETDNLPY